MQLLEDIGFFGAWPSSVPTNPRLQLSSSTDDLLTNLSTYRWLIGRLLYLTISRLDITIAVHKLSPFMSNPSKVHLAAAHDLLYYLKSPLNQGIFFQW